MAECPVGKFLEKVKELPEKEKYSGPVILSLFKLLDSNEKKVLFSLLASNISVRRIKEDLVKKLFLLGVLTVEAECYTLRQEVRDTFLAACTKPVEESILVKTEIAHTSISPDRAEYAPIGGSRREQISAKKKNTTDGVYSNMLYKNISNKPDANKTIRRLMLSTGVINKEGLTYKGFNFLLTGRKHQMWSLILAHIQEDPRTSQSEILTLCELLTKDPKRVYALDSTQHSRMLGLFESLGLLVIEEGLVYFSPSFSLLFNDEEGSSKFLLLESNFRLYIYSNSPLDIFIISLFSIKMRDFPNMIVSMINEESIRQALACGITAGQIRLYLNQNSMYPINENVLEQIRLWEKRMNRIQSWESYIFSNFLNYKDFLLVESYCDSKTIEYKSYRDKRALVVGMDSYEDVKGFIRMNIK
ncbi:transcription initiation factor TFIIH subunit 4 [Nematocida minor]|uniref:transcription initiation factor TFIIH subunit 4 n=1 Tax=Nematocida minor TaxID=1912983 RepID=UPI00221E7915|nr:transcription initiation factor TFIIH subunit 4 [Nematocida minor]KAI5191074.1 transcription initiation factor TFIIH subunit 4 [Nematocida minor]